MQIWIPGRTMRDVQDLCRTHHLVALVRRKILIGVNFRTHRFASLVERFGPISEGHVVRVLHILV